MRLTAIIVAVFCVVLVAGRSADTRRKNTPFKRIRGPPPPLRSRFANPKALITSYVTQPLDHFDAENTETYQMRYMTNDQFFEKDSPILIMLGGEWSISAGFLLGGHMYEIGRDINAFLIYTEHRYYGNSKPTPDTTSQSLRYLSVDQALADVVFLVKQLKQQEKFANSKVVVFGGSYAGNMATWIRLKYPEVINGAVASSGPVLAKADFFEYLETVNDAILSEGSKLCLDIIKDGVEQTKKALFEEGKADYVTELFNICELIDITNELDVQTFFSYISESFSGVVQYARDGDIDRTCSYIIQQKGSAMEKLAVYIAAQTTSDCNSAEYNDIVDYYSDTSYSNENIDQLRLWFYQTCTEFGYYQTTNSPNQPFGDMYPLSYFEQHLCKDLYGEEFGGDLLAMGIEKTNNVYGGLKPNITNIISVHGTIDPWHRLGVVEDLNESSPAVLIKGTSHCVDLQGTSFGDIPDLKAARQKIRGEVMKWV